MITIRCDICAKNVDEVYRHKIAKFSLVGKETVPGACWDLCEGCQRACERWYRAEVDRLRRENSGQDRT